jgi:hypothetical protein
MRTSADDMDSLDWETTTRICAQPNFANIFIAAISTYASPRTNEELAGV